MSVIKWAELREEEFEDAVKKSDGLCMIPVGCFEMHGEHLPVGTDVYEAVAVAELAATMEEVVVFPAFEFGDVAGLVEKKGAINLDPELRLRLLENYCSEIARQGFDKILLLNYHGGNPAFLTYFMNAMDHKHHEYDVLSCFPVPLFVEEVYPILNEKGIEAFPELLPEDEAVIREFVEDKHLDGHKQYIRSVWADPHILYNDKCQSYRNQQHRLRCCRPDFEKRCSGRCDADSL